MNVFSFLLAKTFPQQHQPSTSNIYEIRRIAIDGQYEYHVVGEDYMWNFKIGPFQIRDQRMIDLLHSIEFLNGKHGHYISIDAVQIQQVIDYMRLMNDMEDVHDGL